MNGEFNALGEGLKEAKARWMTAKADLKKLEDWLRKEKAACVPVFWRQSLTLHPFGLLHPICPRCAAMASQKNSVVSAGAGAYYVVMSA